MRKFGYFLLKKNFDLFLIVLVFLILVSLGKNQVWASSDEVTPHRDEPINSEFLHRVRHVEIDSSLAFGKARTPSPTPTPTPSTIPPSLRFTSPALSDKIRIVRGELRPREDSYTCRVLCGTDWESSELKVLQVTRGSEDWLVPEEQSARCVPLPGKGGRRFLHGGIWQTPANAPDESLCFLVVKEVSDRHAKQ